MTDKPTLVLKPDTRPCLVLGTEPPPPRELKFVLQRLWERHPEALGLVARALMAQGRELMLTREGQALAASVAKSSAFEQLRAVWDEVGAQVPDAAQVRVLPMDIPEVLARDPSLERPGAALSRLDLRKDKL